jgi:HEPN domain-containing protein
VFPVIVIEKMFDVECSDEDGCQMSTPEPNRLAETSAWLHRTSQDMRAAAHGLKAEPPLLGDVAFHCQQACEKALRAFLIWHGIPFRETHDLAEIGEACVELDSSLADLVKQAAPLSGYVWVYRYPGGPENPSPEETIDALNITHSLTQAIIERLPEEIRG